MSQAPVGGKERFGDGRRRPRGGPLRWIAYALLLGESLVILIPSIYGRLTPKLFGIPFFYWFQLAWIIVGMIVTGAAYLLIRFVEGPLPPVPEEPGGAL